VHQRPDAALDVGRLVPDRVLGQPGEVHQRHRPAIADALLVTAMMD
jgi:hypothetical protein